MLQRVEAVATVMRRGIGLRRWKRGVIVLAMLGSTGSWLSAIAQNLVATWQGTLGSDPGQRIVIRVTKEPQGEYRALFYSIDNSGDSVPGSAVQVDRSTVTMTFHMIDGKFSGRLAADGSSIAGTWTLNSASQPFTLTRAAPGAEWTIPPARVMPAAMDPHADPVFDVATIKPSNPEEHRKFVRLSPDRLEAVNETVDDLIAFSYGFHRKQLVDAPSWTDLEKFDISAKPDADGRPSLSQWKTMMQKLLADRFKFKFHKDQRELAVYVLSVGQGGAKLTATQGDPNGLPGIGFQRTMGDLAAFQVNMTEFLNFMTRNAGLDRPVVDRTGLTEKYDFKLKWTPDEAQWNTAVAGVARPPDGENPPPPLTTALQEQLGLRLTATKTVTDVYIVDHIEKPSQN
jgi:uncharacterized protein (TIGR03435 family)